MNGSGSLTWTCDERAVHAFFCDAVIKFQLRFFLGFRVLGPPNYGTFLVGHLTAKRKQQIGRRVGSILRKIFIYYYCCCRCRPR